jgi:opacity protein-like surface antigen
MKRILMCAATAALLAAPAGQAQAQEMMDRPRISRFDLGVYAGGSLTSRWYESRTLTLNGTDNPVRNDDDQDFSPGYAPVFGAQATFWLTPMLGLRANGMYAPMQIPNESDGFFDAGENVGDREFYLVNSYFYDLSLALRPFARSDSWFRTVYLFAGGGGLTSNLAGDADACEPFTLSKGACFTYDPDYASVGQGTAGAGISLVNFTPMLGLFGELAAHVYDSPVHVDDEFVGPIRAPSGSTVRIADDRTAVTGRAVIGLKAMFGDFVPPFVAPPPPPPMVEQPMPPPPPPPVIADSDIQVCVLQDGNLANVTAQYNTARGDTMVNGQPFATAFPTNAQYAANASWYINNEPLTFQNRRFVKYGLPRVLGVNEVTRVGEFGGVPVFAETGQTRPEVVYVLVRPGCEFQPYQVETKTGSVRGE